MDCLLYTSWKEVLAGERAFNETGSWLPEETMEAFRTYKIGIKGPLTTPVVGGVKVGHGRQQAPCIGVLGVVEDLVDGTGLHDLAGVHHVLSLIHICR